jgi:hypothetical protein
MPVCFRFVHGNHHSSRKVFPVSPVVEQADLRSSRVSRRRIWMAIAAGSVLVLAVVSFLTYTLWRMIAPPFTLLSDGWVRVVDREWGVELELPGWYTREPHPSSGIRYGARFDSTIWATVEIVIQPWAPNTLKPGHESPTSELLDAVAFAKTRGEVKIVVDESTDFRLPMIDFILTERSGTSKWLTRRRIQIRDGKMVNIVITNAEAAPESDLTRIMESFRWIR